MAKSGSVLKPVAIPIAWGHEARAWGPDILVAWGPDILVAWGPEARAWGPDI